MFPRETVPGNILSMIREAHSSSVREYDVTDETLCRELTEECDLDLREILEVLLWRKFKG